MEAVKNLIDYFMSQGVLTDSEIEYLYIEGFLKRDTWDKNYSNYDGDEYYEDDWDLYCSEIEHEGMIIEEKEIKSVNSDKSRDKSISKEMKVEEIDSILNDLIPKWQDELNGITTFALRFKKISDYFKIPFILKPISDDDFKNELEIAIKESKPILSQLWKSISFDSYLNIIKGKTGIAVKAYREVCKGVEQNELGKYKYILKHDNIKYVYELVQTQKRLFLLLIKVGNNRFPSITYGDQVWMEKNLNVVHYRNGDTIRHCETDEDWIDAISKKEGAWCYFNNDPVNDVLNGKLYNIYAVIDSRYLAPKGWHIPCNEELSKLNCFIGNGDLIDIKLNHWKKPLGVSVNKNGSNSTIFGYRLADGKFNCLEDSIDIWTSDIDDYWNLGLSVRCLKDKNS
jgi:uncharacterized protein (TIGR02145 family)